MLCKFIQESKESWDTFLDTCIFGYNTSHHESTLHTPFVVMFGHQAVLSIDLYVEKPNASQLLQEHEEANMEKCGKAIATLTSHFEGVLHYVEENISRAQRRSRRSGMMQSMPIIHATKLGQSF